MTVKRSDNFDIAEQLSIAVLFSIKHQKQPSWDVLIKKVFWKYSANL